MEKIGPQNIDQTIRFEMKVIKFNTKNISKDLASLGNSRSNKSLNSKIVSKIISDVKKRGDFALKYYQKKFDHTNLNLKKIVLKNNEIIKIINGLDKFTKKSIDLAFERVKYFHSKQNIKSYKFYDKYKNKLAYKVSPLNKVGVYIPGGTASYPSSVIMNAVPAIVAGVKNISLCVPTPMGSINPGVVYAAKICGIKKIYKIGGAQAIAAMAYGTKTVEKVDKIVGPGNIYVSAAKKKVFGDVGIDMVAGPSEITVVADQNNNSTFTAIDLLSQAEHDILSQAILVTTNLKFGLEVKDKIYKFLKVLPRKNIATKAIQNNGAIIVCKNIKEIVETVNLIAPEHLEIKTKNNQSIVKNIVNAGSIFLGEYSPEAIGDYLAGPNHVLPTSGSARFSSGLSVYDFYKKTSIIKMSKQGLEKIGRSAIQLADYEGLFAHSQSIRIRIS